MLAIVTCRGARRPMASSRGYTLLELALVMAILAALSAMALPSFGRAAREYRALAAARYLAGRLFDARAQAVRRSVSVGLCFDAGEADAAWFTCVDGNGNGIRTSEIARGIDTALGGVPRLQDRFAGVVFGLHPEVPEVGETAVSATPGGPIRIGVSRIVSFSPIGSSSSGTMYVRGVGTTQFAVRVFGATGRTRVMWFDPGRRQWETR